MNLERLLQLNIEIEGLLRVLSNRENDEALQMLASKFDEFKSVYAQQFENNKPIEQPIETSVEPAVESIKVVEPIIQESPIEITQTEHIAEPIASSVLEESQPQPKSQPQSEVAAVPQYDAEFTTADEIVANRQNEMRVDEMLTRREARDLRKAFTLNDKFRFRRELFANDDALFADTLNLLSAMKNTEEAIEYLRDDMGWDMDNDDTKDFVNIINNHFAK